MTPPRLVPHRDDKYMGLAFWVASFSKDPHTQMGAVCIGKDNYPLGWGYNGPPRGIPDNDISWARKVDKGLNKYDLMIHAEENAIDHSYDLGGSTMYVTGKPCPKCMLRIITSGIVRVVYFPHVSRDPSSMFQEIGEKTDEIAKKGKVTLVKYTGNLNWMRDRMKIMESVGVFDGSV
jgi:dCMP deaminase